MTFQLIRQVAHTVTRRTPVPDDLESVTTRGEETGSDEAAELIWERVQAVYRSGMHPGIQVCIRHGGDVVVDRSIGHSRGVQPGHEFDPDLAVPMTLDTPINLFSAAKAVTGMTMHKLQELGAASLDERVSEYIPGFERHGKKNITLRQVLSHRSGLPALPPEAFDLDLLTDPELMEEMVCDLRPSRVIGGPPAYHAVVGGFVMDMVSRRTDGRGLRDVLDQEIRQPLGLRWLNFGVEPGDVELVAHNVETGLPLTLPLELVLERVLGARWGHVLQLSNDPRYISGVIPSGNAIVTARDISAFYQCLLNGGELDGVRVFQPETITEALEHQDEGTPFDRMLGLPMRYSSGFMLGNDQVSLYGWNHPRAFGHIGMSNLFTWADPDRDMVVALLMTGKPILGPHVVALPQLISEIHTSFPVSESARGQP